MKISQKLLVFLGLVSACSCFDTKTPELSQQQYFWYQDCPGFDNSKYVKNLDFQFSSVPTTNVKCIVSITADIVQDFFISYGAVQLWFNGIKIIDAKGDLDIQEHGGTTDTREVDLPTEFLPAGLIKGHATLFDDMGIMGGCYDFQLIISKRQ